MCLFICSEKLSSLQVITKFLFFRCTAVHQEECVSFKNGVPSCVTVSSQPWCPAEKSLSFVYLKSACQVCYLPLDLLERKGHPGHFYEFWVHKSFGCLFCFACF